MFYTIVHFWVKSISIYRNTCDNADVTLTNISTVMLNLGPWAHIRNNYERILNKPLVFIWNR